MQKCKHCGGSIKLVKWHDEEGEHEIHSHFVDNVETSVICDNKKHRAEPVLDDESDVLRKYHTSVLLQNFAPGLYYEITRAGNGTSYSLAFWNERDSKEKLHFFVAPYTNIENAVRAAEEIVATFGYTARQIMDVEFDVR